MKQPKPLHFRRRMLLLLAASGLAACVGQLRQVSQPGQAGDVQAISPIGTIFVTAEPGIDPFPLTLTAYPTPGPLPTPYPPGFTPYPAPTSTETPIPVVINLAEELPDSEIFIIFVSRANGAFEKYIIPLMPPNGSFDNYLKYMNEMVNLGPGDVIVNSYGLGPSLPKVPPQEFPSQPTSQNTP